MDPIETYDKDETIDLKQFHQKIELSTTQQWILILIIFLLMVGSYVLGYLSYIKQCSSLGNI